MHPAKKYVTGRQGRLTAAEHAELVEFWENVEGSPDPPHRCGECGKPFWDVEPWQEHHATEHYERD